MNDVLFNAEETIKMLKVSIATLYRLKKNQKLVPRKIGSRSLYHIDDIKDFIDNKTVNTENAEALLKNLGVKITT
jgi:predicted DNA-binding transcriptional regulator AlpA